MKKLLLLFGILMTTGATLLLVPKDVQAHHRNCYYHHGRRYCHSVHHHHQQCYWYHGVRHCR